MRRHTHRPAALAALKAMPLALLLAALALPAVAASSASSASSDAASTSVGSVSTSFEKSSNSSSGKDANVAEGEYRIVEVADAAQRPGAMRLKLQAVAKPGADNEFFLYLPRQALEQGRLAEGQIITAKHRSFGMEFAKAANAFFLVVKDAWHNELSTKAITL